MLFLFFSSAFFPQSSDCVGSVSAWAPLFFPLPLLSLLLLGGFPTLGRLIFLLLFPLVFLLLFEVSLSDIREVSRC